MYVFNLEFDGAGSGEEHNIPARLKISGKEYTRTSNKVILDNIPNNSDVVLSVPTSSKMLVRRCGYYI